MLVIFAVVALATSACAMYDSSSSVVELTEANFKTRVINDDSIWVVEFYAPWCGHCKSLVPEYNKAAAALKGLVKVGAVDMTQHQSVGAPYNVQGFPTIKIFGGSKGAPIDFQGARTAQAIVDAAINELKKTASTRLSGKGGSSGGGSSSGGSGGEKKAPPPGSKDDVVELTDSNFDELVLKSDDMWLVEFYAPWCGHCKTLAPHWQAAATELKGKVKMGALDATVHQVMSNRFGVRGFPTIKYFPAGGGKSITDALDYDGGRTGSDIVSWALGKAAENVPAPEIKEATSTDILKGACDEKQLCVIAVLPHILDCQSKCRNDYLRILKDLGEKFRKNVWGWVWAEAGQQPELEDAFGIGGFGYPAMAALNSRKMKFAILKGPFSYDGINEFLRDLSYGKGQTAPIKGASLPSLSATEPWDGKDGQLPKDDEIDLSDVDLDDEDTKKTDSKKEKKEKKEKNEL